MTLKGKSVRSYKKRKLLDFSCFKGFSFVVPQCLSAFFICLVLLCSCAIAQQGTAICFQKHCFTIEIAQTDEERAKGLMFRENLPEGQGMFFIFEEPGIYGFWMKNTLIPLDMVWLDENMKVVHIEEDVRPCEEDPCPVYQNELSVKYVLELNTGTVKSIGLKVGDQLERLGK